MKHFVPEKMLCRLCLCETNKENAIKLFRNDDDLRAKLVAKYLQIEVAENDDISTSICKSCCQYLTDFHHFFQIVHQRQSSLQEASWEGKQNEIESFSHQNDIKETITLEDDEYSEIEFLSDLNDSAALEELEDGYLSEAENLLDISTTEESLKDEYQSETESILDLNNVSEVEREFLDETMPNREVNPDDLSNQVDDESAGVIKRPPATEDHRNKKRIERKRKNQIPNRESLQCLRKARKKIIISETQPILDIDAEFLSESLANGERSDKQPCNFLTPKMKNNIISEYMQLKCDICQEPAEEFAELKTHFRQKHDQEAYVKCCGKNIRRRHLLVEHIQVHLNPLQFKCEICNKVFKSGSNLDSHKANMHTDKSVLKHLCTLCDRRFAHKTNLSAHMFTHVKERKYQCHVCEKGFKSVNVLKTHIQAMHEEFTFHICDICGKEYKSKQAFDRHVSQHGGPINVPKKPCKICGKWYSIDYLPRHERRAHELMKVDCEKCGKTFKSKTTLSYHMLNSHRKKPIYPCPMCDKTFDRAVYLKDHIYKHTGEKSYSCLYCSREFRSKSSMYRHSRKMHFDQWKEAQSKRHQKPSDATETLRKLNKVNEV